MNRYKNVSVHVFVSNIVMSIPVSDFYWVVTVLLIYSLEI